MKVAVVLVVTVTSLFAGGYMVVEARRLRTQTEADLRMAFEEAPKVLETESFGWAEEGGDRALMRIANTDCTKVSSFLNHSEPVDDKSDYFRMFKSEGFTPTTVKSRYWSNEHGDSKHYVLDPSSCVLYREAFFE